jgi:hypothetical protein
MQRRHSLTLSFIQSSGLVLSSVALYLATYDLNILLELVFLCIVGIRSWQCWLRVAEFATAVDGVSMTLRLQNHSLSQA